MKPFTFNVNNVTEFVPGGAWAAPIAVEETVVNEVKEAPVSNTKEVFLLV